MDNNLNMVLQGKGGVGIVTNGIDTAISIVLGGLSAYALLGYLLYKSDSIAASLAGGSTNMGTADVASSVASGVAAGMAVGATSSVISKTGGSMTDSLKAMRNEMGVTNAGGSGTGPSGKDSNSLGLNSLGDAPGSAPKEPNLNEKELRSMAQEKGVSAVSSTPNSSPATTNQNTSSGNGISSGIESANSNDIGKQLGALVEQLSKNGGAAKPGARDRISNLNDHISREQAATHVSINTHHSD